jgi:hypothetical protein
VVAEVTESSEVEFVTVYFGLREKDGSIVSE